MRPFGHAADLDLDFGSPDRPSLVTRVLAQCAEPAEAASWWSRSVGDRTAALLQLVALTEQRDKIPLTARCGASSCGEPFEFELSLRSLANQPGDNTPLRVQFSGERTVTLRRPTGTDLLRLRDARPTSRSEALRVMLDSVVMDGDVNVGDEDVLSASLAEADPLVDFTVSCRCPVCDTPTEVAVDLEALALQRLVSRQRSLLREVHHLASRYGWTESEVLAVPPARRARYLSFIEEDPVKR